MTHKPPRRVDVVAQAFAARMFHELERHVEQRAGFWLECVVAEMFPGESVEIYGRKISSATREDRDQRVAAALASGATPAQAAKALGVPDSTVRRLHKRRRGSIVTGG